MRKRGKPNVELIIREYNKGFNAEQIAAMDWCEVKAPTVLNILKRNGIKIRQTKDYSDARRELMVEDYKNGMTIKEIADKYDVVVECVRVNLNKSGISLRQDKVDVGAVAEYYKSNTLADTARKFNIDERYVKGILKRLNVPMHTKDELFLIRNNITPEMIDEIQEKYYSGTPMGIISQEVGLPAITVNIVIHRFIGELPRELKSTAQRSGTKVVLSKEEIDEVNRLYLSGKTLEEVANIFGMQKQTISRFIFDVNSRNNRRGTKLCGKKVDFNGIEELYETKSVNELAQHYGCWPGPVRDCLKRLGIFVPDNFTQPERAISNILNKYNIEHEIHNRSIIAPKELDIWIPSHNIGIEVNGLYWHSTQVPKVDRRHVDKFNHCMNVGIKLIQFTDEDVVNKPELIESMILSKLGLLPNRIMARKCAVSEIGIKQANQFYSKWHYQGQTTNAAKSLALIHENEVVALLSYTTKGDITRIERYACKPFTNIVGGYSKLEKRVPGDTLVTFSLGLISDGSVYRKNGYETEGYATKPEFYITDGFELMNRQRFMKHKMPALFGAGFNPNKTEWENVIANGLMLFFGAGITKWVKKR
jgi:putative hef-like homing endonuclease|nr:MAG TPA: endonuclease-like protein [Caudoviricetes sp.]